MDVGTGGSVAGLCRRHVLGVNLQNDKLTADPLSGPLVRDAYPSEILLLSVLL